jgi:ribosomal RNA methyltransferase Nop2
MSSAPGGKTSYIAQLMKNTGAVVANDLKRERHKATVANLHRLGVRYTGTCQAGCDLYIRGRCACVCVHDGRKMPKIMAGFDRVLLDAPCSGSVNSVQHSVHFMSGVHRLGVISRDQSVKLQRTAKDILRNSHLQKELVSPSIRITIYNDRWLKLLAAIDCTDPKSSSGAIIVYSTCSISTEENEQVCNESRC